MSLEQAHTLCATVLGMDLLYPLYPLFTWDDGTASVVQLQLIGFEQVGLCHQLVHCVQLPTPPPLNCLPQTLQQRRLSFDCGRHPISS